MPQKTNINASPYFDDFDSEKNYHKVLFRPGQAIQSRELTTLQSILQDQIESIGRYNFKQGQQVIPGEVGLNVRVDYVKLSSVSEVGIGQPDGTIVYQKYDIKDLVGQTLRGINSGVLGVVIEANLATSTSSDTLFVNYIDSGDASNESTFRQGETLEVVAGVNTPLLVVGVDGSVLPTSIVNEDPVTGDTETVASPAMGFGSAVEVEEGVYFVNGFFVKNKKQLLIINSYSDKPSAKVGFTIVEDLTTAEEDSSLFDNARGYSNFAAPGAHRLKISLELTEVGYSEKTDVNFVQLLKINQGQVEKEVKPADYSLLEEVLARRTYDESGDYVVDNFKLNVRDYYQKDGNNGIYSLDTETELVNGLSETEADSKMVLDVGPGKAYVRGFEIVNKETKKVVVDKARDTLTRDNVTLKTSGLATYNITNVYGSVPLNTVGGELTSYPNLFFNSTFNDGTIGFNGIEPEGYAKTTVNRRAQPYTPAQGIKTIYVALQVPLPTQESDYPTELWFSRTINSGQITSVGKVDVIGYNLVNRTEVSDSESVLFIEFTVLGEKSILDTFLYEYDENTTEKIRYLWRTQADIENPSSGDLIYGYIVDYNELVHPVIGLAKPKNFYQSNRASGFNEDLDIVLSKGRSASGDRPYTGQYKLSYFNPSYFTKLKLDTPAVIGFTAGTYVIGQNSKAFGVIENDPTNNFSQGQTLFVTTLAGKFQPGETIIDEENNSIKIAQENTISHFVVTFRGNTYSDAGSNRAIMSINGVEIDSSVVELKIFGGQIYKAEIIRRKELQETYVVPPVVTVVPDAGSAANRARITAVLNKNTVQTYTNQDVKSFSSQYDNYIFTADIDTSSAATSNLIQVTQFTFSGSKGRKFLTSNGFGTDISRELKAGDLIQYTDASGTTIKNLVQKVTEAEGITKAQIYLEYTLTNDVTNASVVKVIPVIENATKSSLLFPTGSKQVASLVKSTEDTRFKYFIRKDFVTDLASAGSTVTFTAQLESGTQRFATYNEDNFVVTVLDAGDSTAVSTGDILYIEPQYITNTTSTITDTTVTSGSLTITLPNNYFFGPGQASLITYPKLKLSATIEIDKARPKLKTSIENRRIVVVSPGDRVIPLRGQDYDAETIEILSYADVYKLRYVYEGTSTNPPEADASGNLISGNDITYKYTFDNGQRDTLYDVSRIVLKPGFETPSGQLLIAFDYFEHSLGDICTVDSYVHQAGVSENEIPSFNSTVYGTVSLKDVIDLRPKVDTTSSITGFNNTSILAATNSGQTFTNFIGSGGVPTLTPAPDNNIEYTFSFSESQYLDRIDGVFLNKRGDFVVKEGNASLSPSKPESVDDSIALAYIHIPAFTGSTKDVKIVSVDNRRYTMRDIGKLEKRIERLEYYTTLSILEQQTLNMQIKDDIGFDRFKSGFIVDNFETHSVGNLTSIDYQCGIDSRQSTLRPQSKEDSFKLQEVNSRNDQREIDGYVINNNIVTLPYQEVRLLGNDNATGTINPNPFVVIQYVGDVGIEPRIDQWYDTSIEPLVVDNNTKLNSIFLAKEDPKESLSSLYDSFIVNWVGSNDAFFNINSLSDINTEDVISSTAPAGIASSSNVSPKNNELGKGLSSSDVNGNLVSTALQFFARSIPVKFAVSRLKPNTKVYIYMEGRDVGRWVAKDSTYTGIAGNSLSTFGKELVTDTNGNLSGILLVPAGVPPQLNAIWTGDVSTVKYDTTAEEVRFTEGEKTIRFSSSSSNEAKDQLETYAEVKFYAAGAVKANPQSIISTDVSVFKANEGVQLTNSNTDVEVKPNPLAQTFKVEDSGNGVFVTSTKLYFSKKSSQIPIRVYLTNTESGKPGKYIVPGSESVVYPYTYLKAFLTGDTDVINLVKGESITGDDSGASGPLLTVLYKNGIEVGDELSTTYALNREQVYTLVLSNHNGVGFVANENLNIPSVTQNNATNNRASVVQIAKDSGRVVDLEVRNVGEKYNSATITIESPQLPGGSTATANINISDGKVYNTDLVLPGRGYTEAPSVIIKGVGTGAAGASVISKIEFDTPAVQMGVATDSVEFGADSTIPTTFMFKHPVFLQNNAEYALTVETDSIDYELWSSKLGNEEITTQTAVTTQPSLGSLYKSQNTDNWTEDLFEDLKFTLHRANFDTSKTAELVLKNENLGYEKLNVLPFETSVRSTVNATSSLFKGNNAIVKVSHRDNGFEQNGNSYVFFKNAEDVGGISQVTLNGNLFKVSNSGIDFYNITSPSKAGSNTIGGGDFVLATYNRKYEKLYAQVPFLQLEGTKIDTFVKTTNIVPVDSNTQNYTSYSISDYEKTFLNEQHYFGNQKVVASRINQTLNNIDNSLEYKINLSSSDSKLSPVIDLNAASVKTISNRVENATGFEDRFGKRYQQLKFLKTFEINVVIVGTPEDITVGSSIVGVDSGATGTIIEYDGVSKIVSNQITTSSFINGEAIQVILSNGSVLTSVSPTITEISEVQFEFSNEVSVTAVYPLDLDVVYSNRVTGNVISWDSTDNILVVDTPFTPINDDFTSPILPGSAFARNPVAIEQQEDIFRVNDIIETVDGKYVTVGEVVQLTGVDYVPDTDSKNSSSVAKYVTKEVFINNPGTSIDVRTTSNLADTSNVKVFYKIKKSSSQENFDDIDWTPFNIDGNPDNDDVAVKSNAVSGEFEKQSFYQEFKYSVTALDEFSSFAIKIIMKTDDPSNAPKLQDLRAVASY